MTNKDYADKTWLGRNDAFALFTPEEAGGILLVMFFGAVAFDLLSRLLSWMFSS